MNFDKCFRLFVITICLMTRVIASRQVCGAAFVLTLQAARGQFTVTEDIDIKTFCDTVYDKVGSGVVGTLEAPETLQGAP